MVTQFLDRLKDRHLEVVFGLGFLIVIAIFSVWAQTGYEYERVYDRSTETTIQGQITDIVNNVPHSGAFSGVLVVVTTDEGAWQVHLGPSWFIEKQEKFLLGDTVQVTGSQIISEQQTMIAATIRRDNMLLKLRDQNGFPYWRAWRQISADLPQN